MTKKQLIKELLLEKKYGQIVKMAEKNHSQTLKYIQMHLFGDVDGLLRWHALEAIGRLAAQLAPKEQEIYKNLIRRFIWAMNDESGNVPWSSPEGIGVIIANQPLLFQDYTPILITNALDNPMCHRGMLWAIGEIGRAKAELVLPFINDILPFLQSNSLELVGYAVWALGEINYQGALPQLKVLQNEQKEITLYQEGVLRKVKVGILAQEAIAKIEQAS